MAKSGRTLIPRNSGYGYSRASLSAALRTIPPADQARLTNLFSAAAASPSRAALHAAHPPERSRSDPDHAPARHHCRCQGLRAAPRWLDCSATWPFAEGGAFSSRYGGATAWFSTSDRASRRRARHGLDRNARERRAYSLRGRRRRTYRAARARLFEARSPQGSAKGFHVL